MTLNICKELHGLREYWMLVPVAVQYKYRSNCTIPGKIHCNHEEEIKRVLSDEHVGLLTSQSAKTISPMKGSKCAALVPPNAGGDRDSRREACLR